jgi:sarcosine oxidase gamma subunit
MVEALPLAPDSFMQDLVRWPGEGRDRPAARRMETMRVVAVRHFAASASAQAAFGHAGVEWPAKTRDLEASGGLLVARRQPEEVIVVGEGQPALDALLAALAPGREADAIAIELTHGLGVIELRGPRLDDWLARLVDVSAIPAPGRSSRCRLVDVPVLLLRPAGETVLMVADRSLFPYLAHWLAFSHEGAFSDS